MAIFAGRKRWTNAPTKKDWCAYAAALVPALVLALVPGGALADTEGNRGAAVFPIGVAPAPVYQVYPWAFSATNPPFYAFISNEYLFLSVGQFGAWTPTGTEVPGRISLGTTGGSARTNLDDNQALCGFVTKSSALPPGSTDGAVWPYGHSAGGDFPAYLRAVVDNSTTPINVGFDSNQYRLQALFRPYTPGLSGTIEDGPALLWETNLGNANLFIRHRYKLIRSKARLEWTIVNSDTVAHTVALRWNVNVRGAAGSLLGGGGYYYQDPDRGVTDRVQVFGVDYSNPAAPPTTVPATLDIFSRRADTATDIPFHLRQQFIGDDATPPTAVYVANTSELHPTSGGFAPQAIGLRTPYFERGIATAAYYGGPNGYTVPAGGRITVVTYFGLGAASELKTPDFVLGTEAPESLPYNSAAAVDPAVVGNTSATLQTVATRFLSTPDASGNPQPFQIYASVYSQKLRAPDSDVPLSGVYASLTLPTGLRFATNTSTGTRDVATKLVKPQGAAAGADGEVKGDQDATVSWFVEPTGERFGPVTYQVAVSVARPNPLSRSISRTINIPAVPLVELIPSVFQMVGLPFQFDPVLSNNGDPDTIINSLSRPVDEPVVFYQWIPDPLSFTGTAGRYQRATKLEPGVGYFYRPSAGGANGKRLVFVKGATPVANQAPLGNATPVPIQLVLERGWNMIANPYVYEIPLNYLRIVPLDNNPALNSISFADAVRNGLIKGGIFYFDATQNGYRFFEDLTSAIKPWQGYWIFTTSRISVLFATPTLRNSVILPNPADGTEPPTRKVAMTAERWQLGLVARGNNGAQDSVTFIGVSPDAKEGANALDLPKPPTPVSDYVYVTLNRGEGSGVFSRILKPSLGKIQTWNLQVESDKDGAASLLWPEVRNLSRRIRLSVTDLQTGATTDLRSASSIRVNVRKNVPSRFVLTARTEATRPLTITNFHQSGGGRASGGRGFAFNLSQDATVTAVIKTVQSGRTISVLAAGRSASTGETKLVWNGLNQSGVPVPTGPYVIEVTATNEGGERVVLQRVVTTVR